MKEIPTMLECAYCKRHYNHGGECEGKNKKGCLFFKLDPRGCIRTGDIKLPFKLYEEIPPINTWEHERWVLYGNDTSIKINDIRGLYWNKERGLLYVYANCSYYINEFSDGYEEKDNKPKLKIIK